MSVSTLHPQDCLRHPCLDSRGETPPESTDSREKSGVVTNVTQTPHDHSCGLPRRRLPREVKGPASRTRKQRRADRTSGLRLRALSATTPRPIPRRAHKRHKLLHQVQPRILRRPNARLMSLPEVVVLPHLDIGRCPPSPPSMTSPLIIPHPEIASLQPPSLRATRARHRRCRACKTIPPPMKEADAHDTSTLGTAASVVLRNRQQQEAPHRPRVNGKD